MSLRKRQILCHICRDSHHTDRFAEHWVVSERPIRSQRGRGGAKQQQRGIIGVGKGEGKGEDCINYDNYCFGEEFLILFQNKTRCEDIDWVIKKLTSFSEVHLNLLESLAMTALLTYLLNLCHPVLLLFWHRKVCQRHFFRTQVISMYREEL